jgi:hypothetical protein
LIFPNFLAILSAIKEANLVHAYDIDEWAVENTEENFSLNSIVDIDYKNFYFSPTETNTISSRNVKWIEGLGSLSLINAASGDPNISAVGELSCMFKDYEQFYSNLDSISGCNPLNLSVSEIIDSYPEIELFSQSERNRFLLTHADYVKDVAVFAINGVLQKEIPSQSYNELPLDLSELGTGIYILKVNLQNRKTETFKVVVE